MRNAIILHGCPSKEDYYNSNLPSTSNDNWLPWLQKQLLLNDVTAATPEVPHAYAPEWTVWCREVERFDITPDTILVGHSCGGGFWVRYLSEHTDLKVGKVVLVAPWLDPERSATTDFFEFNMDPKLAERTKGVTIFHSDNDMGNVHKSVAAIRDAVEEIQYREFHNYGHFTSDAMGTTQFQELLEEVCRQ